MIRRAFAVAGRATEPFTFVALGDTTYAPP